MKKIGILSLIAALFLTTAGCGKTDKIVIGATPTPHAEILNVAAEILKEKGYDIEIREFTDYSTLNPVLDSGDIFANYFQHQPFLDKYNKEKGTDLVSAAVLHYEPYGLYPGKSKSLDELPEGAEIGVPNDSSNEARALLLLESVGLIKLREGAGITATVNDITENPKNIRIKEIAAEQLPRYLQDLNAAVINGNYALEAGLSVERDAIAREDEESVGAKIYGNILAVRRGDENSEIVQALTEALQSDKVRDFIREKYKGSVVPLF